MKSSQLTRMMFLVACASFGVSHAATNAEIIQPVASAVTTAKTQVKPATTGKVVPKVATTAAVTSVGDSSIPAGSIPVPPKPKKEGLEAAGALKAKAAQP